MASVIIQFLSVATLAALVSANSCRETKLCCPGRDSSCVVQKAPLNAIIEDLSDKPCYCDHACLKLGDCCPDFKETCGVEDCVVSGWGPWSPCDAHCGAGSMTRARRVMRAAHGGHKCPPLLQRRACHAHHNCEHAELAALKETAMLLPASLSLTRRVNETQDIRMNLRARNPDDPESNYHREYCVEFKVQKVSRACQKEDDYKALKDRETVCVKCEVAALRRALDWRCAGHGIPGHSTRFTALDGDNHCHGKWTRLNTDSTECCSQPHFIFV